VRVSTLDFDGNSIACDRNHPFIPPEQLVDWLLQTGNPLGGETHVDRRSFSQLQDDQREY